MFSNLFNFFGSKNNRQQSDQDLQHHLMTETDSSSSGTTNNNNNNTSTSTNNNNNNNTTDSSTGNMISSFLQNIVRKTTNMANYNNLSNSRHFNNSSFYSSPEHPLGIAPSMRIPDFQTSSLSKTERRKEALLLQAAMNDHLNYSNAVIFSFGESNEMRGLKRNTVSDASNPQYIRTPFRICSVVMGYTCSIALTDDGFALSCGSNGNGQCGVPSDRANGIDFCQFHLIEGLVEEEIVQASCGYYFSLFLTRDGRVIGSGDNSHGQLGCDTYMSKYVLVELKNLPPIRSIHAGYYHSLFVGFDGKVYACGQGFPRIPTLIPGLENQFIVSASGGYDYSFFITKNGEVYGHGEIGHMIHGGSNGKSSVIKVTGFNHFVTSCSSGYYHTLFTTREGAVYSCGRNQYNCLNRSIEKKLFNNGGEDCKLLEHKYMKNIVQVSCGGYHSGCLDAEGRAYTFGHSGFYQACIDSEQPGILHTAISAKEMSTMPESLMIHVPTKGNQLKACAIACGGWNTMVVCSPYIFISSSKNVKEMIAKLKQFALEGDFDTSQHSLFDIRIVTRDVSRMKSSTTMLSEE